MNPSPQGKKIARAKHRARRFAAADGLPKLQIACTERRLPTNGTRQELCDRLNEYIASQAAGTNLPVFNGASNNPSAL